MNQFNPIRKLTGNGWLYANPLEHSLVMKVALIWGFSLADFDTWLINLEPCPAKDEMVQFRETILVESTATLKRTIELLKLRRNTIDRENYILPLANGVVSNLTKKNGASGGKKKFEALKAEAVRLASIYTDKTSQDLANLVYLDVRRFADKNKLKKLSEKEELKTIARWIEGTSKTI